MSIFPSLKAMAENKLDGVQKATFFKVDPKVVEFESGFNVRDEGPGLDAHIETLYNAMKAGATIPPIDVSVVDGHIIVRDGHCRTRAALRLVEEGIPYLLEARQLRGNEVECVFHMLGSAEGRHLTPLEQGRGYMRLVRYGLKVSEIVERKGVSRTTVDNYISLAEAPVALQRLLIDGKVSAQVAIDAIQKHRDNAVAVLTALVSQASNAGVAKVTKKHVAAGPKVSQKIALSFVNAAKSLRERFEETDDELMALDDNDMIEVPAKELKELLTAYNTFAGGK